MNIQVEVVDTIESRDTLRAAVFNVLNMGTSIAKQCDMLWREFCRSLPADGEIEPEPSLYALAVAPFAVEWWNAARVQLIEDYETKNPDDSLPERWTDFADFAAIQSGFNSFRQKVARQTLGYTFTVDRTLTVAELNAGETCGFALVEPAVQQDKAEKPTAKAKGKGRKAQGATMPTAESGATALETVTSNRGIAGKAIVDALAAFPDLVTDPAVAAAIKAALKTVAGRETAKSRRGDKRKAA